MGQGARRARRGLTLAAFALAMVAGAAEPDEGREIASTIRGREVAARVRFLASEFMEGREAGTRGERLAAEYLRDFHLGLGLSPAGDAGSFYQAFDLHAKSLGPANALATVHGPMADAELRVSYPLGDGFVPFVFSPSASVEAPVVFAGYGIAAPEYGYDDYAKLDVKGAIVLVLRHEPRESDPESSFKGLRSTRHAAFLSKVRLAQEKGALGLLLVTDPLGHDADARDPGNSLARWNTLAERDEFDDRPQPGPYQFYPEIAPDVRIPAAHVSIAVADDLLSRAGVTLEALQRQIDEAHRPASRRLVGTRVALTTDIVVERVAVQNVIARLEGSDPALVGEPVFVGGHYDHLGYGRSGGGSRSWGQIHPGADDNGSGTATILSVAEALSRAPRRPRRPVVFLHFTAEEKGLMGSRWYVDHPTAPLAGAVAMLNLDMVGRNDPAVISVVGNRKAEGLDALVKELGARELGLTVNNDAGSGIDRSDQWSFALAGVPAVAFFSGVHEDYHRPTDVASRIVTDKLENVARLVTQVVWRLAEGGRAAIEPASTED